MAANLRNNMTKPFIEVGDWVSFYRAVAPGSYVNMAIIARVLYITECNYVKGSLIYNTDQGPVGEKHILEVRKAYKMGAVNQNSEVSAGGSPEEPS
jgi:hypothetical protein